MTFVEIREIRDLFLAEFSVMDYSNACGIGVSSIGNQELGISLHFETQEKLDAFPFKEERYRGVPVYRKVTGVIRAQRLG